MTHATPLSERHGPSPSAGYSVHELMGLDMNPAAEHPRFDDDIWDLTGVLGAPIQLKPQRLVWDFTAIPHSRWQVIVREFLVRAPRHDAVATLPWARREQLSLRTCTDRRFDVLTWLRWLAGQGVERLTQVTQEHCEQVGEHPGSDLRLVDLLDAAGQRTTDPHRLRIVALPPSQRLGQHSDGNVGMPGGADLVGKLDVDTGVSGLAERGLGSGEAGELAGRQADPDGLLRAAPLSAIQTGCGTGSPGRSIR
jgi:hypothetical protein